MMKLKRVIFRESCEAPGSGSKVAYLQSTDPARRDCYAPDLRLASFGVLAGDEVYPLHMVRRMTVDAEVEDVEPASDLRGLAARDAGLPWSTEPPRRGRGRPPKQKAD